MLSITEALSQVPLWVYPMFFYLLITGGRATLTQGRNINTYILLPSIFFLFFIKTCFLLSLIGVLINVAAMSLGLILGFWTLRKTPLKYDFKHNLVQIPGNWTTFVLLLSVFSIHFFLGFCSATHFFLIGDESLNFLVFITIAHIFVGTLIGRSLCYFFRKKFAPHTDLRK